MKIQTIEELKNYFRYSKDRINDGVFVDSKIRKEWMINHETTTIGGRVYGIDFIPMGGGIWKAILSENTSPHKLI